MKLFERRNKDHTSYYVGYYDRSGKRKRYCLKGISTRKSAELAFADFQLKYERNLIGLPTDDKIKLADVLDARIEERRLAGCVDRWIACLKNYRRNLLKHFGDGCVFRDLDDNVVANYRIARQTEGASAQTINKELMLLAGAGRLAITQGKIGRLPWNKIERAIERHVDEAWGYLKENEIEILLDVLKNGIFKKVKKKNGHDYPLHVPPNPAMWRMVTFLLNTGARRGEMFALKWSDVSMESRTVRLVSSKSAKNGKSAKVRYVPINENLWELFQLMPAGAPSERVFRRDINLRRKFKLALHWAGLPEYRVHDLRHTFASHLVINHTPLYTVSKLLGHSSTEVTQRYAHLANENLIQAVESLKFGNGRK